jgi:NAD+ kinase
MHRIGIVYREHPSAAIALAKQVEEVLAKQGITVWRQMVERDHDLAAPAASSDLILVLGGDGTLLSTARQCAEQGTPLLGVNFGHVGFLAELEPDEVLGELPHYLARDYWVDERSMLSGTLEANGQQQSFLALNDVVVARGPEPRVIRFTIRVANAYYASITADGMIVATATGSTAYNLAAGGPILYPSVKGMVLTPIAPHLAVDRPLVLEPNETVQLELANNSGEAVLAADGQLIWPFDGAATVTITTSPLVTRFLRRRDRNHFYQVLNEKLRER